MIDEVTFSWHPAAQKDEPMANENRLSDLKDFVSVTSSSYYPRGDQVDGVRGFRTVVAASSDSLRAVPDSASRTRLGVVYVTHNSARWLAESVRSLRDSAEKVVQLQIVVVDNDSSDETLDMATRLAPPVTVIAVNRNVGFSKGVNIGLRYLPPDADVLLLNPDTILFPDTIPIVLDALRSHPTAGLVGCRLMRPDGRLDAACKRELPRLRSSLFALSPLSQLPWLRRLDRYRKVSMSEYEVGYVEAISGAFMLIRAEALSLVGVFDEDYFLYGEDLDYCLRVAKAGFRVLYTGKTAAVHVKYGSISVSNYDAANKWFHESMEVYYRKHLAEDHSRLLRFVVHAGIRLSLRIGRPRLRPCDAFTPHKHLTRFRVFGIKERSDSRARSGPHMKGFCRDL